MKIIHYTLIKRKKEKITYTQSKQWGREDECKVRESKDGLTSTSMGWNPQDGQNPY